MFASEASEGYRAIEDDRPALGGRQRSATLSGEVVRPAGAVTIRERAGTLSRASAFLGMSAGSEGRTQREEEEEHAEDEVHLLEVGSSTSDWRLARTDPGLDEQVLDQAVGTTTHLTNIQSAFIPSFLTQKPVCDLEEPLIAGEEEEEGALGVELKPGEDEIDPVSTALDLDN